jgi:hypothetical protein
MRVTISSARIGKFWYQSSHPTEEGWYRCYWSEAKTVDCILVGAKGAYFWHMGKVYNMDDPQFADKLLWGPPIEF